MSWSSVRGGGDDDDDELAIAFAHEHSRAFTILEAVERVRAHRVRVDEDAASKSRHHPPKRDDTLRILVVGADRVEGTNPEATAEVFRAVLERGGVGDDARGFANVEILCAGPNVTVDDGIAEGEFHAVRGADDDEEEEDDEDDEEAPSPKRRRAGVSVGYHVGLYHDIASEGEEEEEEEEEADAPAERKASTASTFSGWVPELAVAFNAGMWGYSQDEWRPTIDRIVHAHKCPLVVTGYTVKEAESDEDALRAMTTPAAAADAGGGAGAGVEWLWETEANPFRSLRPRALRFDRSVYVPGDDAGDGEGAFMGENAAWMCLRAAA